MYHLILLFREAFHPFDKGKKILFEITKTLNADKDAGRIFRLMSHEQVQVSMKR